MNTYFVIPFLVSCLIFSFLFFTGCYEDTNSQRSIVQAGAHKDSISNRISKNLLNPLLLKVQEKEIYVLDYGNHKIKVFGINGEKRREIGRGQGQGPGDVLQAGEFDVSQDSVWMVDMRGRKVVSYTDEGEYVDQFRVDHPINKLEVLDERIITTGPAPGALFHEYSPNGTHQGEFGTVLENQQLSVLTLTGSLSPLPNQRHFLFAPKYASYAYLYSGREITKTIETIDGQNFPEPKTTEGEMGTRVTAPEPPIEYPSSSVSGQKIFITTNYMRRENPRYDYTYIDVYDVQEGSYLKTVRLPEIAERAIVHKDRIYAIYKATVKIYDLPADL